MRTASGKKVVKIRPAFGSIRHVKLEGERYYREASEHDIVFESDKDEEAWHLCGPQPEQEPIDL